MTADRDTIIEAAITAHRPADPRGEVAFHPAFHDLDAAGREALFTATSRQRTLERALAPDGLSSTARTVLRRVRGDE